MGIVWEWLNDSKTIILIELQGELVYENLESHTSEFWPALREQPHKVDVVVDLRRSVSIPNHPVNHLIWLAQNRPDNAGRVVFIVKRKFGLVLIRALHHAINRIYPKFQLMAVLTQEEALRLLVSSRDSVPLSSREPVGNQSLTESPR